MAAYKWNDKNLPRIEEWASKGLTDGQIAINLAVDKATFSYWKRTNPTLSLLLEKAREPVIQEVENALYKRACGLEVEDVTVERCRGKKIVKRTKRQVAGDVKAMIFYLTNRMPDKWRFSNKIEKVTTTDPDDTLDLTKLNDDQLAQLGKMIKKAHGDNS